MKASWGGLRIVRAGLLAAAVLGLAVVGCGGDEDPEAAAVSLAAEVCADLEGAVPVQQRAVLSHALDRITDEDIDGALLLAEMSERCPEAFDYVVGTAGADDLSKSVSLELGACKAREASGTVTNDWDETVRVVVEVRFVDEDDVLLGTGTETIRGLRAGETGRWQAPFFGDDYARCQADVESARPD